MNQSGLSFYDRIRGTDLDTGSAVRTFIGIDNRNLVPFGDRFLGALVDAGAAVDAFVRDLMSHNDLLKLTCSQPLRFVNIRILVSKVNLFRAGST